MDGHKNKHKKTIGSVLIITVGIFLLMGLSMSLLAKEPMPEPGAAGMNVLEDVSGEEVLFAKAAEYGSVKIIVGFDIGFQPEGSLLSDAHIENQRLSIDFAQDDVLNMLAPYDVRNVKRFDYIPYMALEVDEAGLEALWRNPKIFSIHEDVPVPPALSDSVPLIEANKVWDYGFDGSGITVAILDTGVRKKHEFLDDGKVVSEACYSSNNGSTSVCPNGEEEQVGPGAGVNCPASIDGCDHGTHVAGIAAGTGGADGLEGVAKGADIISIQVFSEFGLIDCLLAGLSAPCVLTRTSDQIKGLERVLTLSDSFDIAAVNMSLGGGWHSSNCDDDPRKAAIDNLLSVGIATIAASGNDGRTNAINAPACISSAVSVGATNKSDAVANFSNSASILDLLAPGVSIRSSVPKNSYANMRGTSMAAPHVTGAFALLKQANPDASAADILDSLKITGVEVLDSRNSITKPRINILAALNDLGFDKPEITDPQPGVTISSSQVTFVWEDNGLSVNKWQLWVGTTPGGNQIFNSGRLGAAKRAQEVNCIPLIGAPVYVRLKFKVGASWASADFEYQTTPADTPEITSPLSGATLTDNKVTFNWNAGGLCAVENWKLYVGTSSGDGDLYYSGKLPGTDNSHIVKGLPYDGSKIHVRLKYKVAGIWQSLDETYIAPSWTIGITSPTPGSTFTGRNVTFTWADSGGEVTKWRLCIGDEAGDTDYYDSGILDKITLQENATKLPRDGRKLYVRLKFRLHGIWEYADYQYKALDSLPKITAPEPGSTLDDHTVTFEWDDADQAVKNWKLWIGSAAGLRNYHDSGALDAAVTSDTCDVVPTDGRKVYVRLNYKKGSVWKYRDYTYTAVSRAPSIISPVLGTKLLTSQEFVWQSNDAFVRNYKLWVGSSMGDKDLYDSGTLPGDTTTHTATGLPFDGSTVYVRLKYKSGVKWKKIDYEYEVQDTAPYITGPISPLEHSSVTFTWDDGDVTVQKYRLYVGKKQGQSDYHDSGNLSADVLSEEVRQLPINGRKLYVRLKYKVDGTWFYRDYEYNAVTWMFEIYIPEPKSQLPIPNIIFRWRKIDDPPVDKWKLKVGTSVGIGDIYASSWLEPDVTSQLVEDLPLNGKKVYVRLQAKFDGDLHFKDYWYRGPLKPK
jgi:subtilisin family serine protease